MGVYAVIGVLAGVENVFPPVPADTAVVLGAFLSQTGLLSPWTVFLVTWTANVSVAAAVYVAARTVGRQFFTGRLGRRLMNPAALTRLEVLYRKYGMWGVFVSRFVPAVRAVVPPFAGVAGLGSVRTLIPMAVASGLWYGILILVAATLITTLDDVAGFVVGLNWFGALVLAVVVGGLAAWIASRWRVRRKRSAAREGQP